MILFATYFDSAFSSRGIAMLKSITCKQPYKILVLALDEDTENFVASQKIPNVIIIPLKSVRNLDTGGNDDKDFFFKLTAEFCYFCKIAYPSFTELLYIDADIYFYQPVDIILDEVKDASVAFTRHRHPSYLASRYKKYGLFNVGINYFKNDDQGNKAIELWRHRCEQQIEGATDRQLSFFSDQVLVDDFDSIFSGFKTVDHIGINVAPWNAANYCFSKNSQGDYLVDNELLVCYHYSNLVFDDARRWDCSFTGTPFFLKSDLREMYVKYISKIHSAKIADFPVKHKAVKGIMLVIIKKICGLYITEKELSHEIR